MRGERERKFFYFIKKAFSCIISSRLNMIAGERGHEGISRLDREITIRFDDHGNGNVDGGVMDMEIGEKFDPLFPTLAKCLFRSRKGSLAV